MSRQVVVAFIGSVTFVAIAFWLATQLFPSPVDPIIGKWRLSRATDCSEAQGYMSITTDAVTFNGKGLSASPIVITAMESDANGRRLRSHLLAGMQDVEFFIPYTVVDDKLEFGSAEWTPEAKSKYPSQIAQMDLSPISPVKLITRVLRLSQPFHRCPN